MSSQKEKKDAYIHLRVTEEMKREILQKAKEQDKTMTSFILENVMTLKNKQENVITNNPDISILKKMIIPFAEKGVQVDLTENEIKRIQELWREIENT